MTTSWLVPGREQALVDLYRVFRVYELHRDALEGEALRYLDGHAMIGPFLRELTEGERDGVVTVVRESLRQAFNGDPLPYEARLRSGVALLARRGAGFPAWQGLFSACHEKLVGLLATSYPDPSVLTGSLVALGRVHDRHIGVAHDELLGPLPSAPPLPRTQDPEASYRELFDGISLPTYVYDTRTMEFLDVNRAMVEKFGISRDAFLRNTLEAIVPAETRVGLGDVVARLEADVTFKAYGFMKPDGETFFADTRGFTFSFGRRVARLVLMNDLTDQRRTEEALRRSEEQLRQAHKMEAIGRLAGGVAHDFNNLLSVILGYSDMLLQDLGQDEPMREDVREIRRAAQRGADLSRQLLLFSRHNGIEPKVLDLGEVLKEMENMLHRVLGADVQLLAIGSLPLGRIRADRGHVEQVIMNLVVNARDAMPTGGKLTLETSSVTLDEDYARVHHGVSAGKYVLLAVTDNGLGMDKETLAKVFEPFFTTKERGKGTGLGLSTVFGIVQQSGGHVWLYSEPGKGTTVRVYFPSVEDAPDRLLSERPPVTLRGAETVLLVEDDDQVRAVVRGILRKSGYNVLEAKNAGEALLHSENFPNTIHLLLTDVVMPQVSGPELATRLMRERPSLKVLCMSGYTEDSVLRHGLVDSTMAYLQKPITPASLSRKVRAVLDGGGSLEGVRREGS